MLSIKKIDKYSGKKKLMYLGDFVKLLKNYISYATLVACLLLLLSGCDPWAMENKFPNLVTITKTTKFGKADDKVSPLKSKTGVVKMSHKTHEDLGLKCIKCHHKFANDARIKQCAKCHIGNDGYETMHGLCLDCHIKNDGPQKCVQCH